MHTLDQGSLERESPGQADFRPGLNHFPLKQPETLSMLKHSEPNRQASDSMQKQGNCRVQGIWHCIHMCVVAVSQERAKPKQSWHVCTQEDSGSEHPVCGGVLR